MTVKGWDGMENPNWRILIAVTAHVQFPPVLDEESHSIAMFSLYFTELHSSINFIDCLQSGVESLVLLPLNPTCRHPAGQHTHTELDGIQK